MFPRLIPLANWRYQRCPFFPHFFPQRSVVEEVLEGILFEVEADVRYVITEKTVRGGEAVKQSMTQPKAPLSWHVLRRLASRRNAQSPGLNQP